MNLLIRIFGWPHELLHVLALLLIGQRPKAVTQSHVDIPDDLSSLQYVFVAGLPAFVFWSIAVLCIQGIFASGSIVALIGWIVLTMVAMLAAVGTLGDLYLIVLRLVEQNSSPHDLE